MIDPWGVEPMAGGGAPDAGYHKARSIQEVLAALASDHSGDDAARRAHQQLAELHSFRARQASRWQSISLLPEDHKDGRPLLLWGHGLVRGVWNAGEVSTTAGRWMALDGGAEIENVMFWADPEPSE